MARNHTVVQTFDAEFRGVPFGVSKEWVPARLCEMENEPYAVSTIARDLRESGEWAELPVNSVFPRGIGSYSMPVDRVFVRNRLGGRFGTIIALCDRRRARVLD